MTLEEIRSQVRVLSGRYELCSADGATDNKEAGTNPGIDYFITAGQRLLDTLIKIKPERSSYGVTISAGTYSMDASNSLNHIEAVRFQDTSGALSEPLVYMEYQDFLNVYPNLSEEATGTPTYWTKRPGSINSTYITIGPPCDEDGTLVVYGSFHSSTLTYGTDTNVWSVIYPDVLIKAALYQLEVHYRNTQGQQDWMGALTADLHGMDKQQADWEDPGYREVRG